MEEIKQTLEDTVARGKKKGASAVKVWYSSGLKRGCDFKNGTLKEIESSATSHYSVTVIKNGRQGTSTVNSADNLTTGLERALQMADIGKKVYFTEYPLFKKYPDVKTYSPDAVVPLEKLVEENNAFAAEMNESAPLLHLENNGKTNTSEQILALSNGMTRRFRSTYWSFLGSGQVSKDGDVYFIYDFSGSRTGEHGISMKPVIQNCISSYEMSKTIREIKDGLFPVLFDPQCTSMLGMIINAGVNGKQVMEGSSPLKDKLGTSIFSKNITVIDNPHIDYNLWASAADGDGVPTRKLTIIEKGVLKNFAYDLNTAARCGTEPTGNPGCRLNAPMLLPGITPGTEIIKSIKKGIYVKQLIGFGQGNIINGDFSANVGLGFLIENGEITGRIKNTMIAGNLYDLAKADVEVSSDCDPVNNLPYLLLNGVRISTKKQ